MCLYIGAVLERVNEAALMPEVWTGLCTLCFHVVEYQPPLTLLCMFGFISYCGTS